MSRLDVIETDKTLLELNDTLVKAETTPSFTKEEEEIDLNEWLEVFAEDQVKLEGCR
jgi:hypothetical protein